VQEEEDLGISKRRQKSNTKSVGFALFGLWEEYKRTEDISYFTLFLLHLQPPRGPEQTDCFGLILIGSKKFSAAA
jgi:hypothetical protein